MSEIMLETQNLSKMFGSHMSNDDISIHINRGEIYGLVGRNGAGKTTLMKMISHIYTPSKGKIFIMGEEQKQNKHKAIGALIEEPALMPNLSAYDNLLAKCYLCNVPHPKKHAKELLALVKLEKTGKKHVAHFSLGMRQRVGIALALVGWPELVLLDEPINGLDPQGILEIRNIIMDLNEKKGITFLISSHLLGELQRVANRFGIISEGKLVRELSQEDMTDLGQVNVRLKTDKPDEAVALLADMSPVMKDEYISLAYKDDETMYEINKKLLAHQIEVKELSLAHQNGEEIFLDLMGGEHYV